MSAQTKIYKLFGGTHDGETCERFPFQKSIYLTKRITIEEDRELMIDDVVAWKAPEEVYEKGADGNFHYVRTVHYKPCQVLQ